MPTVEEYTDPYLNMYTPPPEVGEGVCEICHSWTGTRADGTRYSLCSSCWETMRQVRQPVRLVVPFSLYVVGEQLWSVLWGYKNSPDKSARERLRIQVAAMLARFLRDHGGCIRRVAGREWEVMTVVPSSGGRAGTHPLEVAVRMARAQRPLYRRVLEPTDARLDHREANERAYRVTQDVRDTCILLVDDTFTTGARVQSAASALALAGADIVAAVVLGRVIQPDFGEEARVLWEHQRTTAFDFDNCCLGH